MSVRYKVGRALRARRDCSRMVDQNLRMPDSARNGVHAYPLRFQQSGLTSAATWLGDRSSKFRVQSSEFRVLSDFGFRISVPRICPP